jgi:hypothetical protein
MLKKFTWIAAALLATLAMAFFGCTDAGGLDDGTAPRQANDLVIEGKDIVLSKMGSSAGQDMVTIDGTKVTFKGASVTSAGFYYEFPDAAADYPQVVVYFKILSITTGRPGFLIKNSDMSNYAGIVNDQDSRYQMNDSVIHFAVGQEYNTGEKPTNAFKGGRIGFQHQAYDNGVVAESGSTTVNQNVEYSIEVTKIVFPGAGTVTDITPPTYTGAAGKVEFTAGYATANNRLDDIVVDSDPTVFAGYGMAVSATTGYVTFDGKGRLNYKFPTKAVVGSGATATTVDIDIEKDFDNISVEYTVANGSGSTGATTYKAVLLLSEGADGDFYANLPSNGQYLTLLTTPTPITMQTWGAKGTGGFTLRANDYDWTVADGGNPGGGKDAFYKFDIKITKVTFTKAARYKVHFYVDNNPVQSYDVLTGNSVNQSNIPATVTAPRRDGWVLEGWYDDADISSATKVSLGTAISADTSLFANFVAVIPQPVSASAVTDKTLFSAVGTYNAGTTPGVVYEYKDQEWWIVATTGYDWDPEGAVGDFAEGEDDETEFTAIGTLQKTYGSTTGHTRIAYQFSTLSPYWSVYSQVRITYDMIKLGGSNTTQLVTRTAADGSGGDVGYPDLVEDTNQTLTYNVSQFPNGWLAICKNNNGAMLLRITKVELIP